MFTFIVVYRSDDLLYAIVSQWLSGIFRMLALNQKPFFRSFEKHDNIRAIVVRIGCLLRVMLWHLIVKIGNDTLKNLTRQ